MVSPNRQRRDAPDRLPRAFHGMPKVRETASLRQAHYAFLALGVCALGGLLLLQCGCSKPKRDRSQDGFFIEWLEAHGETNVIADEQGVGLANNPTRLQASVYKTTPHDDGTVVVETEFRTRMPAGGELVDYVAGIGDSAKKAEDDAKVNFVLTTFHVLYRGFLNHADPHQTEEKVQVNGVQRLLICGDLYSRGTGTNQEAGFRALLPMIRKTVATLPLSAQPHAIKVVYSQKENAPLTVAAELDGQMHEPLAEKLKALPWPRQTNFYLVKQFMLLK